MSLTYPRLGEVRRSSVMLEVQCDCCADAAHYSITIQNTALRTDDEVLRVCNHHLETASRSLQALLFAFQKKNQKPGEL